MSVIASHGSDRFLKLLTGHNTDGFDLNGDGFTIENWLDPLVSCGSWVLMWCPYSYIYNQVSFFLFLLPWSWLTHLLGRLHCYQEREQYFIAGQLLLWGPWNFYCELHSFQSLEIATHTLKNRALSLLAMSLAASLSAATRSQIGMLLQQSVAGNLADQTWQIANKRSESKQTSLPQAVPSRTWSIKYARTDWFWSYGEAKPWVGQYRWQNFELRRLDISSMSQRD